MLTAQVRPTASRDTLAVRESLAAWCAPDSQNDEASPPDVIRHAYDQALLFHKVTFQHSKGETWLSKASSMQDVLAVLEESQIRYHSKTARRSKPVAAAVSWWKRASSKMIQYEKTIDALVSSNPEYAALVWGAMKFLFKATLNHEELSSKIAQAFAEVGDVLPDAELIARLHPTEKIRGHLANAYVQIVEFCIRATRWYEKMQKHSWKKVLGAAFKSWSLEFQDIRNTIDAHIKRVRELAAIEQQVEMRETLLRVRILQERQHTVLQAFGIEPTPLRVNPSVLESLPFVPERVSRYLACNPFNPKKVLDLATTMRDRRRARGASTPVGVWASQQLKDWISTPDSALLQLQGSAWLAQQSRDLASDLIQLLQATSVPVIWYLSSISSMGRVRISAVDVLRSLIEQTLNQQHQDMDGSQQHPPAWRLNDAHFSNCKTDHDWLRLLVAVVNHLPRLVIVIDTHQEAADDMLGVVRAFWDEMKAQRVTSVVKVLVLTYGANKAGHGLLGDFPVVPAAFGGGGGRSPRGSLSSPRAGSARAALRFRNNPRMGTLRSVVASQGPEELKPFVLKLVGHGTG